MYGWMDGCLNIHASLCTSCRVSQWHIECPWHLGSSGPLSLSEFHQWKTSERANCLHRWFNTSLFNVVAEQWSLERSSGWAPSNYNKQASAGTVSINKQQKLQQQWQRNKWGQRISTKSPHQHTTATIHNLRNGSIDSQHMQASSMQHSQGCWPKQKHHNKQSQINYLQMAQQHQQKDNCGHDYQHYYSSSWYQQPKQQ